METQRQKMETQNGKVRGWPLANEYADIFNMETQKLELRDPRVVERNWGGSESTMYENRGKDWPLVSRDEESGQSEKGQEASKYIVGWRLHLISFALLLSLFMSQMESSIVSTSVIAITNDLGGYEKSSWVFSAYLLTYSGLLIICAKLSDIFGRKPVLVISIVVFVAFSGACGGSQTFIELIMFRWVQGLGGSGIYSIATLLFFELVPPAKWPDYTALVSAVIALSLICGPLFGGAISAHGEWRWVFYINLPIGVFALGLVLISMPKRLQTEPAALRAKLPWWHGFQLSTLARVDVLGALLLLGACLLLSTALQQATAGVSFTAAKVLPLLVLAGPVWIAFVVWQWFATTKRTSPEPVLPWRLFTNRVFVGLILNTYFAGTILTVCIVQLPQRFTTVNGQSAFQAGVRLLPFGAFIPAGSVLAAILIGRARISPLYILLAGGFLEVIGTALLSQSSAEYHISAAQYGYQILAGTGVGFFNATLVLLVPYVVDKRDLAVGTAAIAQFRLLGGAVGLAIVTTVMNRSIAPRLSEFLAPKQVDILLESTSVLGMFSESIQSEIRSVFSYGHNLQMKALIGFAAAQVPATLLMWGKEALSVPKI
ncbi:uncharacterized protein KY384_003585 [Bacidia gigantensis]|uniref:uncharacterized protein n=1 Tax=Bacidia gigantensis TaxID=2732470 RepID=UPI001D0575F3|nr:uncharacterized protein KY384_003585 [Bacidia gigantensis]KAG8531949.1 hypothetical protein KY384_003585 [Bacidia gigantensis]